MKKRGFGQGFWNGFGGKLKGEESIEQAAVRELEEEVGITPISYKKRGVVTFYITDQEKAIELHIFSCSEFTGEITESDEMKPQWFDIADIPYDSMWPSDLAWLPLVLEGKNVTGELTFLTDLKVGEYHIEEV